jgi:two-component system sensor histidine kinase KdpD
VLRVEETGPLPAQRTDNRHSLGLPLHIDNQVQAALVFIRFGGPSFLPAQIHLAEYIATHVAQLLEHRRLLEQVADLEARRRLDSLQEDFISTITHELLTPLGFIKGYATTLLRQDAHWDAATQHEFLTIIDEETDRLHELIDNLLDSSRLQAGTLRMQFQPIRLDVLLREILLRFRTRHEGLVINLLIGTPGVLIQADPSRLVQVFDNILSNAVKYASGSAIDITLRLAESEVQIDITDYGPGLPEESLDSLFQRFYRGPQSSAVRGTGLGLYISRKLVQAHHGALTARSSPGQGLTVTISLPITI